MEISNPFITSSWVRGEDFFGREDILERTREFLQDPDKTILLVYGQRRMGKTSLLKRIQVDDRVRQLACPVYYNLQDKPFSPLPLLLAEITRQIIIDLDLKMTVKEEDFNASSFEKEFLPPLIPSLQENKYLLLVFDEADVMETVQDTLENSPDRLAEPGENTPAYRHFIPFLENLAQEIQRQKYPVKLILAVGRDFKPYRENQFDAIAKLDSSSQLELAVLSKEETENLLNRLTASSIPFEPGAVDEIYALTSGHPYFTQCLAKASFEAAEQGNKNRVTPGIVRQQFIPTLKKYTGNIYSVWDSFSPKDQIVLYLMAVGKEERQPVTLETLQQKASVLNVLPALENLPQTLERLKTIGIIEEHRQGDKETQYDFQVEFLRKWVALEVSRGNIFEKKKQLEQHQGVTRQKGVLLLADIVDFTP